MALRLAAFAALSVRLGVVSGCADGGSLNSCDLHSPCELGEFCNYESGDSGVCEGCGGGCDCGLPQGGEEDCNSMCTGSGEDAFGEDAFGFGDGGCPWFIVGFLAIFLGAGVGMVSAAVVNDKLTGERFKLHHEQGTEVPARCIARWTTTDTSRDSDGHTSTTTYYHNTFVFCVPMPAPTPTAQHLLITKDFTVGHGDWAHEGGMVQVNHLLSATGDARNVTLVAEMSHEGTRHICTIFQMAFGCVFALFPLVLTVAMMDCGAKVLPYVLLIVGCPVYTYRTSRRKQADKLAHPDGKLEQVDEQGRQMAMTGPIGAISQNSMNPGMSMNTQQVAGQPGMAQATAMPVSTPTAMQMMQVNCPPSSTPGSMVQVQAPNGQQMQVQVPAGVGPGMSFQVQVPEATPGA